jgi:hypothetical protein
MNLDKLLEPLWSMDVPTGVMWGAGIILLLVAFKLGKFLTKLMVGILALALIAVATWWHFHRQ